MSNQQNPQDGPATPESGQLPPPQKAEAGTREFIAEVDCIYNGRYTAAGTRVTAATKSIPHFRRA
jgi:hypothetical protein